MVFEPLLSNGRQGVGAVLKTLACRINAFKHSYTVEFWNRLRVGVRAKSASVATVSASYRIEKPQIPENRKRNRQKT